MMIGSGVSRWTMLHLGTAVAVFLLALALLATGYADPVGELGSPQTLIVVHLVTIGWLSLMMLGALYQFVPVITSTPLYSQRLPLLSFSALLAGLVAMVVGFLALGGMPIAHLACLPIGGSFVIIGFGLGAADIAATLWRARPLGLPARFIAAGLGFLLLAGVAGLCFALAFALPDPPRWLVNLLTQGLMIHVMAGLGGWVTLTAMGVSYRLLSMFMLAPEEPRRVSHMALFLTAGGLFLFVGAGLVAVGLERPVGLYEAPGAGLTLLGSACYLVDIRHLYTVRARRHLELNSIAAGVALALFACVVLASTIAAAFGTLDRFGPAIGYLFVFGWLSGLGLSQLYKIVPFMTWLEVFGKRMGKGPVPRVQDLVNERRAAPWFALYFAATVAAAGAMIGLSTTAFRLAATFQLLATLAIAAELWRAHRPDPNAAPKPLAAGAARSFASAVPPHRNPTHGA